MRMIKSPDNKSFSTAPRRGFVLITVLLLVVLLTAVLLRFNQAARTHLSTATAHTQRLRARYLARAGLDLALAVLRQNPDPFSNETLCRMLDETTMLHLDGAACEITLACENGKLNVNRLRDKAGRPDRARLDQFLNLFDRLNRRASHTPSLGYGIAPALLDWIDPDDHITVLPFVSRANAGAESDYYASFKIPRPCGNRPLETIAELRFVREVPPEWFIPSPPASPQAPPSTSDSPPPILPDVLTVYGEGLLDLNTAPPLVIQSLSERLTPDLARRIVKRRREQPFTSVTQLKELPGFPQRDLPTIARLCKLRPTTRYYTITARAAETSAPVAITAVIKTNMASQKVDIVLYQEK